MPNCPFCHVVAELSAFNSCCPIVRVPKCLVPNCQQSYIPPPHWTTVKMHIWWLIAFLQSIGRAPDISRGLCDLFLHFAIGTTFNLLGDSTHNAKQMRTSGSKEGRVWRENLAKCTKEDLSIICPAWADPSGEIGLPFSCFQSIVQLDGTCSCFQILERAGSGQSSWRKILQKTLKGLKQLSMVC